MVAVPRPVDILLVEDDAGDVWLTRDTFEYFKIGNSLHVVSDGIAALRFVRRQPPYEDAPRPGLILLDLDLPRLDGREVLAELTADPALRDIPVVILTTSDAESDILRTFDLGAGAYVTKPVDFDRLVELVRDLDGFYLTVVRAHRPPATATRTR
ncbi:MAG: response regulator [Actinophytocola sp.]|uniref:response regulator n=1 Tax=Actinophytocola sp. TaxID=1872138 RepID=UPI0013262F81|nr:response regulator [Actinophytocola sp.]MPZ79187.1 response regulator [Actinophytocola sp.]